MPATATIEHKPAHNKSPGTPAKAAAPAKACARSLATATYIQQAIDDSLRIQPKLTVGAVNDPFEREADEVAERVMSMREFPKLEPVISAGASHGLQRKCACGGTCSKCQEPPAPVAEALRMKSAGPGSQTGRPAPPIVHDVLRSPGRPLDTATRNFMEPRFGRDFGQVRVHTDSRAAESAKAIGARAYTADNHVVFGAEEYQVSSEESQRLLAHELTHTLQQAGEDTVRRKPAELSEEDRRVVKFAHDVMKNLDADGSDKELLAAVLAAYKLNFPLFVEILSGTTRKTYGNYFVFLVAESKRWPATEAQVLGLFSSSHAPSGGVEEKKVRAAIFWKNNIGDLEGSREARERLASALMRHDDTALHTIWTEHKCDPDILAETDRIALDWLVQQIRVLSLLPSMPPGASLVTGKEWNLQIAEQLGSDDDKTVSLGMWGATATKGDVWGTGDGAKRIVRIEQLDVIFEFVGHEGIYYSLGNDYFWQSGFIGFVATGVAQETSGLSSIGRFIEGLLTALASPVVMLLDTAAKVLDMLSMGASILSGGVLGYFCLSSTCREYESCLKSGEDEDDCQSQALKEAMESATVIIPLYRQGQECLRGNEEACGAIAALALGMVEGGLERLRGFKNRRMALSNIEVEDAAIRGGIDRLRPDDLNVAEALEKPRAAEETAPGEAGKAKGSTPETGHPVLDEAPAIGSKEKVVVTDEGLETCSPNCPLIKRTFARELGQYPELSTLLDDLEEQRIKSPKDARLRRQSQWLESRLGELKARNDLVDAVPEALKHRARAVVDAGIGLDRQQLEAFRDWIAKSKSKAEIQAHLKALEEHVETANVRRNAGRMKGVHPEDDAAVEKLFSDANLNDLADGHLRSLRLKVDVDEVAAVGAKVDDKGNPISREEAMRRATDAHNREFKDYKTNQRTKHLGTDVRDQARTATPRKPVSLAKDPSVLFTHRFGEIIEVNKVFDQAMDRLPANWEDLEPTEVKARVNKAFREIVREGQTPEGIAVRDGLAKLGYEWQADVPLAAVKKGS